MSTGFGWLTDRKKLAEDGWIGVLVEIPVLRHSSDFFLAWAGLGWAGLAGMVDKIPSGFRSDRWADEFLFFIREKGE